MESINEAYGINAVINNNIKGELPGFLSEEQVKGVRKFHSTIEGYEPTPLVSL